MSALDLDDEDLERDDAPEPGSYDEDLDEEPVVEAPERPAPKLTPVPMPTRPASGSPSTHGVCRHCQAGFDGPIPLFVVAGSGTRTVCAKCSGKTHREVVEQTRDVIRDLKAAVAVGNDADAAGHMVTLRALVGDHQATETLKAIRDRMAEGGGAGKGGKGGRR